MALKNNVSVFMTYPPKNVMSLNKKTVSESNELQGH